MLELDKFGPPLRWMVYEARSYGLLVESVGGAWVEPKHNDSMNSGWKLLEVLPIKRLMYGHKQATKQWYGIS